MTITVNGSVVTLDWGTIVIWVFIGIVAGFLASRVALGHGLGILGDVVVGILGALIGGFLASVLRVRIDIADHPIIGTMIIAFVGAVLLLLVVRMLGGGRKRRRSD